MNTCPVSCISLPRPPVINQLLVITKLKGFTIHKVDNKMIFRRPLVVGWAISCFLPAPDFCSTSIDSFLLILLRDISDNKVICITIHVSIYTIYSIHLSIYISIHIYRMTARRSLFPGGVCKIKCKADIAGGVWATSQSQV